MITLENNHLKLLINERDGQWTSLFDKEHEKELLWQGSEASWNRQAPLLFPIVGRLKENTFTHYGRIYSMTQHGFLRDQTLRLITHSENEVIFEFESNVETLKIYPFQFKIRLTTLLKKNAVITRAVVFNNDIEEMIFGFGGHPGFNVDHHQDNQLILETKKKRFGQFLLEGPFVSDYQTITQKEFDLKDIDLNNTLILDKVNQIKLKTPQHEISLSMKPTQYIGVWSPVLKGTTELDGCVCLEPWWGIADCVDHNLQLIDKKGMHWLKPQESQEFEFTIKIVPTQPILKLPQAVGPYSMVRETKDLIFSSGQLPLNPETNQIEATSVAEQTRQCLLNIKAILQQYKLDFKDVIKTTVFLKDMATFVEMNEVYAQFFEEDYPARSAIEVARLPKDALVEIEFIANKK